MPRTIKENLAVIISILTTIVSVAFGYGVLNTKVDLNDKRHSIKCEELEKKSYIIEQDIKDLVKMSNENSRALSRIEGILSK